MGQYPSYYHTLRLRRLYWRIRIRLRALQIFYLQHCRVTERFSIRLYEYCPGAKRLILSVLASVFLYLQLNLDLQVQNFVYLFSTMTLRIPSFEEIRKVLLTQNVNDYCDENNQQGYQSRDESNDCYRRDKVDLPTFEMAPSSVAIHSLVSIARGTMSSESAPECWGSVTELATNNEDDYYYSFSVAADAKKLHFIKRSVLHSRKENDDTEETSDLFLPELQPISRSSSYNSEEEQYEQSLPPSSKAFSHIRLVSTALPLPLKFLSSAENEENTSTCEEAKADARKREKPWMSTHCNHLHRYRRRLLRLDHENPYKCSE